MPTGIITGASRGLGLALTRALAADGWRLVVDARDARALERATVELDAVLAVPGDVADYPLAELERVYAVNVFAPLALFQLALPRLAPGATVLNITSDAAVEPYPG